MGRQQWKDMEVWSCRLLVAVLCLPVTVPLFLLYEIVAVPVACLVVCATGCARRRRDSRTGRRPEPNGCGGKSTRCLLGEAIRTSLKISEVGLDWAWMPFWRLFTEDGRNRCAYIDMSQGRPVNGQAQQGSVPSDGEALSTHRCQLNELPPKPPGCCRIVFISDTHGKHELVDVPAGDVLCHTGDILVGWQNRLFGYSRARQTLRSFDNWLSRQPHAHKVVVGGNHDAPLEEHVLDLEAQQLDLEAQQHTAKVVANVAQPFKHATYLQDSGVKLPIETGCELSVWGCPWSKAGSSANQAFRSNPKAMQLVPPAVDVLLSHSRLPRTELHRAAPRIAASGHFHCQHGARFHGIPISRLAAGAGYAAGGRLDVNAAICNDGRRVMNPAIVVDLPMSTQMPSTGTGTAGGHYPSILSGLLSRWSG